jgi:hypothetical protein
VDWVEVDDGLIRIIGKKSALEQLVAGRTVASDAFAALHAIGAPEGIRTPGLCLRRANIRPCGHLLGFAPACERQKKQGIGFDEVCASLKLLGKMW